MMSLCLVSAWKLVFGRGLCLTQGPEQSILKYTGPFTIHHWGNQGRHSRRTGAGDRNWYKRNGGVLHTGFLSVACSACQPRGHTTHCDLVLPKSIVNQENTLHACSQTILVGAFSQVKFLLPKLLWLLWSWYKTIQAPWVYSSLSLLLWQDTEKKQLKGWMVHFDPQFKRIQSSSSLWWSHSRRAVGGWSPCVHVKNTERWRLIHTMLSPFSSPFS